jgi:hypothetical protein
MDLDADHLITIVGRLLRVPRRSGCINWSKPVYGYVALIVAAIILRIAVVIQ